MKKIIVFENVNLSAPDVDDNDDDDDDENRERDTRLRWWWGEWRFSQYLSGFSLDIYLSIQKHLVVEPIVC